MSKGIKIEGVAEMAAKLNLAVAQARKAAGAAVVAEVAAVKEDAQGNAPVGETRELHEGIRGQATGLDGEVRSTARHSTFVEHGTFKDEAQPFMAPAAERSRKRFPAKAGALIKAAVEGIR